MLRLPKQPDSLTLHRYTEVNGTGRAALEAGCHVIPFLIRPGKAKGKYRIVLHPEGKAALDPEFMKKQAADGATLILPDLFGTGETAQPNHTIGLHHQFFRQLLWVGHSLVGEWTFDALALVRMLKKDFKAAKIEICGVKDMGFTALCANAFSTDVSAVEAVDSPASLVFDARTVNFKSAGPFVKFLPGAIYSLVLAIPGFLQWGDISLAAALGGGTVEFTSPRTSDGTKLNAAEVRDFRKELADVRKKLI